MKLSREVLRAMGKSPNIGRHHRRGHGMIEDNKQLTRWAEELASIPGNGPRYIARVLRLLSAEAKNGLENSISDALVRGWWERRRG